MATFRETVPVFLSDASPSYWQSYDRARQSIGYVNSRVGLAFSKLAEGLRDSNRARVWLLGAIAVSAVAARAGINVLDGVEESATPLADSSGPDVAIETVEIDIHPAAYMADVPPIDDQIDVDVAVDPDAANAWNRFTGWLGSLLHNDTQVQPWLPEQSVDDPAGQLPGYYYPDVQPPGPLQPDPEATPEPPVAQAPTAPVPTIPGPDIAVTPESDTAPYPFDTPPQPGEYLWTYMKRIGVPPEMIMEELERAATELEEATNNKVEWHGGGKKRWLEINNKSDTLSLWQMLLPYLKR